MTQATFFQRLEGFAILLSAAILFALLEMSWWWFALLLLVPDLSMLGYLLNNRTGQILYNIVHTYALPLALALSCYLLGNTFALALGLIWLAHIGLDRALGYGLKEAAGFKHTHLGTFG